MTFSSISGQDDPRREDMSCDLEETRTSPEKAWPCQGSTELPREMGMPKEGVPRELFSLLSDGVGSKPSILRWPLAGNLALCTLPLVIAGTALAVAATAMAVGATAMAVGVTAGVAADVHEPSDS